MALKDLPHTYKPQAGDVRAESLLDGTATFRVEIYTGHTWAALHTLSGDHLAVLTAGAENLGRQMNPETDHVRYYWRGQVEPGSWVVMAQTPMNARWSRPRFGLGELVWLRRDHTAAPRLITGISLVEAFDDHPWGEDEDLSSPQTWEYHFADETSEEENELAGRLELAEMAARLLTVAPGGRDFGPHSPESSGYDRFDEDL